MSCKHKNLYHREIIEVYHETSYEDGEPIFNSDVGFKN